MNPIPTPPPKSNDKVLGIDKRLLFIYQMALQSGDRVGKFKEILLEEIDSLCKKYGMSRNMNVTSFTDEFWLELQDNLGKRFKINIPDLLQKRYSDAVREQEKKGWGVDYGPMKDHSNIPPQKIPQRNRKDE